MLCNYLIVFASIITAIATGFIAYYACANNRLTKETKKTFDHIHRENNELIFNLIAATLASNRVSTHDLPLVISAFTNILNKIKMDIKLDDKKS